MPEIKNNFLQGKMNKDLDERLIPNGQYRHAENVEVSTAEDAGVGVVKNILGNKRVEDIIPNGFKCVGSIADEKNNKLYWFITTYEKDAIIEYDAENDITSPVIVDLNAGNYKAVLKFSGNIITGINIIDNLLFWTDNNSDPKKINIDECKKGTPDFNTHTQLVFDNGSFDGMTLEITANASDLNTVSVWPPLTPVDEMRKHGLYFYYQRRQLLKLLGLDFNEVTNDDGYIINAGTQSGVGGNNAYTTQDNRGDVRHYRNGKFLGIKTIIFFDNHDGLMARLVTGQANKDWYVGDVIFGVDVNLDIEERHITVIKPKPLNTPSVKINHEPNLDSTSNIPNLFETKFPRFSYRYKYKDGEFSTFAPFTDPVFNPKYTKDPNKSSATSVLYDQNTAYDIKEPQNKAMINSIHSIELTDFITPQTPEDVIEVDILYKQENSSVIYSVGTIKHSDPEWHAWSNNEGTNIGFGKQFITSSLNSAYSGSQISSLAYQYAADGGYNKGRYIVTTENIYAALPANQLLRPWDNVPRKALAQEIVGNRIVYGNYLQNYDIGVVKPEIKVSYSDRKNKIGSFSTQGLPSIKSQRNYQLGVIYCDKYGRETPVFTSDSGAISIPWQEEDGTKNASKSFQINTSVAANFPEWVDSLKFFVKETSNEYYNLVMDKAWVNKSTYELDNSEGHLWISFPSSDRNKISEEDYIILKKKVGVGEEQVNFENKFKVIDIKNEAPDAIKYQLVNYGTIRNTGGTALTSIIGNGFLADRMDTETDSIRIDHGDWWDGTDSINIPLEEGMGFDDTIFDAKNLYISWRRLPLSTGAGVSSKKYKITGGKKGATNYVLKLSTKITKIDADIAHHTGDSSATQGTNLHADLLVQIEKKELKDTEDFSGKFFVKISKNQITDLIESGEPVNLLDQYQISAKTPSWYWEDDKNSGFTVKNDGAPDDTTNAYGLTNYFGYNQSASYTGNHIQSDVNDGATAPVPNGVGNYPAHFTGYGTFTTNYALRLTDYAAPWSGIFDTFGPTFFVDSMHAASMQSKASDYAKYNCVLWAGGTEDQNRTDSNWSYPPLKTWLTDFKDGAEFLESLETDSENPTWYNGNLITTTHLAIEDPNWNDLKVDGWVGSLQNVNRHDYTTYNDRKANQVNGLEGFVTTNSVHATGPRRWFSGITGSSTEHGVGVDTKTYSDDGEIGRHFMHLSFFAPGKDLHDGDWSGLVSGGVQYGSDSLAANLQGIWGGGHFTGDTPDEKFGVQLNIDEQHFHLAMEGNNAVDGSFLPGTPGPGVGYGYDIKYRELHERQWDPTFNKLGDDDNKIRDFIRKLHPGSQFKFNWDPRENVYTIKKVVIKKLYNHTSWRKPFNRYISGEGYVHTDSQDLVYRSVEQVGLEYLDTIGNGGGGASGVEIGNLKNKIVDFGKSHNRRLCYIIELDKNPTASNYNPIDNSEYGDNKMCADHTNDNFTNIEFLEPVQSVLLSDLSKFPAIWEIDPKKKEVDLDIYYEASNNIPIRINSSTNELFAPIGCEVEVLDSAITGTSKLMSWDGATVTLEPGFVRGDGTNEIDYTGLSFKFTREDSSYTIAEAGGQQLIGEINGYKTEFGFREDIGETLRAGLSWYNCFSFGNGIESNRIRDDFNEMFITNGVKASTTTQETYEEERRLHGLIYSGIYNSNSGVNDLNQFIMAEKSTKDLNPTYGSIQKLFQRRISLIAFCEDRVISITSNKDAIYNADGNPQLISTNLVLGDANPFVGEYGISKNPESFASESYRAYFADKQRGAVLRLSKDGLTPISKTGMHDWFRDNLPRHTSLIGTYDSYKEDYNLTLSDTFGENIIYDSFFETGEESTTISGGLANRVTNPGIYAGTSLQYPYEEFDVLPPGNPTFGWGTINQDLWGTATITNHEAIPYESLQLAVTGDTGTIGVTAVAAVYTAYANGVAVATGATAAAATTNANNLGYINVNVTNWAPAVYQVTPGNDSGWWYDPRFTNTGTNNLFGPPLLYNSAGVLVSNTHLADAQVYSTIKRVIGGISITESNNIGPNNGYPNWSANQINPSVEKIIYYPITGTSYSHLNQISQAITRDSSTKAIVFDRPDPFPSGGAYSYVEFKSIGGGTGANYPSLFNYNNAPGTPGNEPHAAFFNGDEIHIQFELTCYITFDASGGNVLDARHGYNFIIPKIELFDGNTPVSSSVLCNPLSTTYGGSNPYSDQQTAPSDMGGDFQDDYLLLSGSNVYYSGSLASQNSDYSYVPYREFRDSSTVTFPDTQVIPEMLTSALPSTAAGTRSIVVSASFKFRDSSQQNSDGSYSGSGVGIEEVKVIDDLRIRISNDHPKHTTAFNYPTTSGGSNKPLRHQLWEINKLLIKKGFGVTAPHTNYVPPVAITSTQTTQPVTAVAQVNAVAPVDPVPPYDVPAWTEVTHHWLDDWVINWDPGYGASNTGTSGELHQHTYSVFGNDYFKVQQSGLKQDPSDLTNVTTQVFPTTPIPYVVPQDWGYGSSQVGVETGNSTLNDAYGSAPIGGTPWLHTDNNSSGSVYPGIGYDNPTTVNHDNNYLEIVQGQGDDIFLTQDISNDPWTVGSWYLVDVEVDESYNANSGLGSGDGDIFVQGVVSVGNYVYQGEVHPEGIGVYRGGAGNASIQLMPVTRTEYGTTRTVLRAIFQFASDAVRNASQAQRESFVLWVWNSQNAMRIQKVITKKLDYVTSTGDATNWIHSYNGNPTSQAHSFSHRELYWKNNMLCWDVPTSYLNNTHWLRWAQSFNTLGTQVSPEVTPLGWRYNFTVSDNPDTGDFSNKVRGFITRDASGDTTPPANGMEGLYFHGLEDVGNYEIKFNMDGDTTNWTIEKDGVDYSSTASLGAISANPTWTYGTYGDKIGFMPWSNSAARFAISNILLTDETIIFQGGSAGSWNFDGFDTSINNWIYWDITNQRLTFENAPYDDPNVTRTYHINANQWIDKPIKEHEQYRIQFTSNLSSGKFRIYYFNSDGKGFIWYPNLSSYTGVEHSWNQILTIGSHSPGPNMPLRDTFVIQLYDAELTNGWVDNITMTRIFSPSGYEEKTLTFSEDVNGWTSFKSFVPESGVSLSKKYFTMKDGGLFQHYVPMVDGQTEYNDNGSSIKYTAEEADNYNIFYDTPCDTAMKIVLNSDPSTIKTFNTLNYEGSQAYIKKPLSATPTNLVDPSNPDGGITIHNAEAWNSGDNINGWNCTEIKTDMDTGSIVEFIKKEGKWFNYIKGKTVSLNNAPDTSRFSVQGIGVASSVTAITSGTGGGAGGTGGGAGGTY